VYLAARTLLTTAPKDATPQEIIETIRAEAQSAYEDLDAETAQKIKIPKLVKLPDADYTHLKRGITALKAENDSLKKRLGNLETVPENLRDENITANLAAEPDSGIASTLLTVYLHSIVDRILPPSMTSRTVSAGIEIVGRDKRIMIGDWLLCKKTSTLSRCTAIGECEKRRWVQEWQGLEWGREHVVCHGDELDYSVITEAKARELAPGAFPDFRPDPQ